MFLVALAAAAVPPPVSMPVVPNERAVRVEPVHATGDAVVWFPEEARPVQVAVATFLAGAGWAPLPLDELDTAMARLDAGLFPEREGGCNPLPPATAFFEAHYPGVPVAEVDLWCDERPGPVHEPGCHLRVTLSDGAEELARWEVGAPLQASPDEVAAHVPGLVRVPSPGRSFRGGGGFGGTLPPVSLVGLVTTGPWSHRDLAELHDVEELHASLAACAAEPAPLFDWKANPLQLELDRAGAITRCERQVPEHHAPAAQACMCDVLRAELDFPRGEDGRRARFDVRVSSRGERLPSRTGRAGGDDVDVELSLRSSTDASLVVDQAPGSLAPAWKCLREAQSVRSWPIRFRLGADGRPTSVQVASPRDGGPERERACLERALVTTRFTCPLSGAADVSGMLTTSRGRGFETVNDPERARLAELDVRVPSSDWVFNDLPLPTAPLLALRADGEVVRITRGNAKDELRLAADERASVDALLAALRARGPGLRRVFLLVGGQLSMRFLVNVPADDATIVPVPPNAGRPDASRVEVPVARYAPEPGATVGDLVRTALAARVGERILGL